MKFFLLFAFLFAGVLSKGSTGDTLRLNGVYDGWLPEYLQVYKDCSQKENSATILEKFKRGAFQKVKKGYVSNVVNYGITDCHHWFALIIHNESDRTQDYLWNFYNEGILFTFYETNENLSGFKREESVSHTVSRKERAVPLRSMSFRISILPGETKTLLVKTELTGRKNLYFPTDISTEADILWWELDYSFLLGRYFGFFFFAAVFNLCLFAILRKRFYGVMLVYILSLLSFNLVEYLHDLYIIPDQIYPFWSQIPRSVFLSFALIFNIKVFQNFTQLKKYFKPLNHYLSIANNVVLAITLFFLICQLSGLFPTHFLHELKIYFNWILFALILFFIVSIVLALKKKVPYVWHYLGGNSLLFISIVLYFFNHTFQIIHLRQFIMPGNMIFAFAFEVVYLMIVFTLKYKKDFDQFSTNLLQAEDERRILTEELISTQEKERMRVAQDIHDGIGGSLQAFRFLLSQEKLENGEKLQSVLKDINVDFKQLIHKLSPRSLKSNGLFKTIQEDVAIYKNNPTVDLNLIGEEMHIPWGMKINVYRIYQELFTNALKHAKEVSCIGISIAIDKDEVRLMVEDDGKEEIESEKFENASGLGFDNIRSRIAYYNGEIHIHSSSEGTSIIINLPIQNTTQ